MEYPVHYCSVRGILYSMEKNDIEVELWQDPGWMESAVRVTHKPSGITTVCTARLAIKARIQAIEDLEECVKLWELERG